MAKKKKSRMVWRSTMYAMPTLVDIKKGELERNGYVNHFETEKEAMDYKWKQLIRIKGQYTLLDEQLPEEYANQIKLMEKKYVESKEVS